MWHVAINDVPVGPMKFEDLKSKMTSGLANGESLVWREGMHEWRPAKEVAEIQDAFLGPSGKATPPIPSSVSAPPRRIPTPRTGSAVGNVIQFRGGSTNAAAAITAFEEESAPTVLTPNPVATPIPAISPPELDPLEDDGLPSLIPGASSVPAPMASPPAGAFSNPSSISISEPAPSNLPLGAISGKVPAISSEAIVDFERIRRSESSRPSLSSPSIMIAPRRGMSVGAWVAIAGASAFGVTFAFLLAQHVLVPPAPVIIREPAPVAELPSTERTAQLDLVMPAADEPTPAEEDSAEVQANPSTTPMTREEMQAARERQLELQRQRAEATESAPAAPTTVATNVPRPAEEFEDEPDLSRIQLGGSNTNASRNQSEGLSAEQLTSVVGRNRPSLQHCYERAIRGQGGAPSVRVDVSITVGASGSVSAASASANNNVAGLTACIESSARRWRFPASGAASQTRFPVVFQAAGG